MKSLEVRRCGSHSWLGRSDRRCREGKSSTDIFRYRLTCRCPYQMLCQSRHDLSLSAKYELPKNAPTAKIMVQQTLPCTPKPPARNGPRGTPPGKNQFQQALGKVKSSPMNSKVSHHRGHPSRLRHR